MRPTAGKRSVGPESKAPRLIWYHTIELPGGIVSPGEYDTRRALAKIPFPNDLSGKRCLDVGTHDGFWAFAMERACAREVVAIDLDDPRRGDFSEPGPVWTDEVIADRASRAATFAYAHDVLGSGVQRRGLSVYELSKDSVGEFDFAFIGTLLLHLRDPVRALTSIRNVLAPGGRLLVNDVVSLGMTLRHPRRPVHALTLLPGKPFWWVPNVRGLRRYVEKAGFHVIESGGPYFVPRGVGYARPPLPLSLSNLARNALHNRGMVHGWVLGESADPRRRAAR
jgi:tRNA (mo5U34)-methyltransferase